MNECFLLNVLRQHQNQPSSPMPRSPMLQYSPQQQAVSPMMINNSPHMRRPPSAGEYFFHVL